MCDVYAITQQITVEAYPVPWSFLKFEYQKKVKRQQRHLYHICMSLVFEQNIIARLYHLIIHVFD